MAVRIAMLFDETDARCNAICSALAQHPGEIELQLLGHRYRGRRQQFASAAKPGATPPAEEAVRRPVAVPGRRLNSQSRSVFFQLMMVRPDLIFAADFGSATVQAALYQVLFRRCRTLLNVTEQPSRFGIRERLLLANMHGLLAEGGTVADAFTRFFRPSRIFSLATPVEMQPFYACGDTRSCPAAHRLIYVGDLSPEYGVADLSIALWAWAEQNPDRLVEIWWVGNGDLAGVLEAQPLPHNVSQRFLVRPNGVDLASVFAQCGVLIVPSLVNDGHSPILEAIAAGLPVVGSRHNRNVRQFVQDGINGWLFDPLQPMDTSRVLSCALNSSVEQLDQMRARARCFALPPTFQRFAELLQQIVDTVMSEVAPRPRFDLLRWMQARSAPGGSRSVRHLQ